MKVKNISCCIDVKDELSPLIQKKSGKKQFSGKSKYHWITLGRLQLFMCRKKSIIYMLEDEPGGRVKQNGKYMK
ncbi:CLUMA_CG016710, isoform A [Clunio marinus]|uniref:CLUMA_CG016710, isoform A n=1 Tax=Clunio marinus TaxID=568069 RepID=A0A1J1IUG0_9DIPT|nr:CLUMA_CG016710, isoform A [Clunio marinus]